MYFEENGPFSIRTGHSICYVTGEKIYYSPGTLGGHLGAPQPMHHLILPIPSGALRQKLSLVEVDVWLERPLGV